VLHIIPYLAIFGHFYKKIIMKTIAVLTDFSERSEHAARYALHLAQKIKADILLFNTFLTPSDIPLVAAEVAWPLDYEENLAETEKALQAFGKKLEHWSAQHKDYGDHTPKINCECQQGPLTIAVSVIEKNKDILLIVMGAHGADGLTTLMLGNSCRQLIDGTRVPLLLIPEHARFSSPQQIAFATELNFADIVYLSALCRFASYFSAEITIIHVQKDSEKEQEQLEAFMNRVAAKVDYNKINYRKVTGKTPRKGLEWLMAHHKPDILAMMHHDRGFFAAIFEGSQTQKMAAHTPVPILIFTYSAHHVFAF
jgi:nucleotide-binding universal stress UspA family protein